MKAIGICVTIVMLIMLTPIRVLSEIIDVQIKGVDDGARTTRQQDYKEAVLFAKREAIERAGVKIKSMTTVKDLVVNSDYIESQAEAVLLPGYNILDMGYSADGTYQVVIVGRVRVGNKTPGAKVIAKNGQYTAYDNGTILDNRTGLMWASYDNGKAITWYDAKRYCKDYRGGNYTDWRVPTCEELKILCKSRAVYSEINGVKLFNLSNNRPWSSTISHSGSYDSCYPFRCESNSFKVVDLYTGNCCLDCLSSENNRSTVLPVRDAK